MIKRDKYGKIISMLSPDKLMSPAELINWYFSFKMPEINPYIMTKRRKRVRERKRVTK
jgi:hypothetical protein